MTRPVEQLRRNWDEAAREDAQFNVVTIPGQTEAQFYGSGHVEIETMLDRLEELGVQHGWRLAMDFGAGLGRTAVALAEQFDKVVGVDVSGEMVRRARQHPRVQYHRADSLENFAPGAYDLVYSNITLQHMPGFMQQEYVAGFFRLAKPGGVVVFELPDWPDMRHVQHALAMGGASQEVVESWIDTSGGELVAVDATESAGPSIPCYRYIAVQGG